MLFTFDMQLPDNAEIRKSGAVTPLKLVGDNIVFWMDPRPTYRSAGFRVRDEAGSSLADLSFSRNSYTYATKFTVIGSFKCSTVTEPRRRSTSSRL